MHSTEGMTLRLTHLACKQAYKSGLTPEDIQDAFDHPTEVGINSERPGQYRIVNSKMVIIGVPEGDKFVGIVLNKGKGHRHAK